MFPPRALKHATLRGNSNFRSGSVNAQFGKCFVVDLNEFVRVDEWCITVSCGESALHDRGEIWRVNFEIIA